METIKTLWCLLAITAISCTDNETKTAVPQNDTSANKQGAIIMKDSNSNTLLKGTWIWVQTTGGFAGVNETPASTGTTREVVFYGTNSYRFSVNGVTTSQGSYAIMQAFCFHTQTFNPTIHFSNAFIMDLMVENISSSSLELSEEVADGFLYRYVRN